MESLVNVIEQGADFAYSLRSFTIQIINLFAMMILNRSEIGIQKAIFS